MPGCISRWKSRRRWWGDLSIVAQRWGKLVSPFTVVIITFQSIAKKNISDVLPNHINQARLCLKIKMFFEMFHYHQKPNWFPVSRKTSKFDGAVDFYMTYFKNFNGNIAQFLILGFFEV